MTKKLRCAGGCGKSFVPNSKQAAFLAQSQAKGLAFAIVACPHCNCSLIVEFKKVAELPPYRCPVSHCTGWVCFVEARGRQKPFWGCGECGSVWRQLDQLRMEIDAIVEAYRYRRKAYRKLQGQWVPADPVKEPADYDERVEREPRDQAKSSKRG